MTGFRIGDVVRLKSGGPPMTVTETPGPETDTYHCVWFDGRGDYHSHHFEADVLVLCFHGSHPSANPGPHIDTSA